MPGELVEGRHSLGEPGLLCAPRTDALAQSARQLRSGRRLDLGERQREEPALPHVSEKALPGVLRRQRVLELGRGVEPARRPIHFLPGRASRLSSRAFRRSFMVAASFCNSEAIHSSSCGQMQSPCREAVEPR